MPFRPAVNTSPPATLQARRSSGFGSASRRGGPSGFPAVRATMDGGECCSVGNKLTGASAAVPTNFANCLIFFGQEINRGRTRRNTIINSKTRRRGVFYDTNWRQRLLFFRRNFNRFTSRASFRGFLAAHCKVCSQIRNTRHPARCKVRDTSRSRILFADNFRCQKARLFFGLVACLGQPCQKQPSTKSASRTCLKTKSGRTHTPSPRWEEGRGEVMI
jgi:hypothetical protein